MTGNNSLICKTLIALILVISSTCIAQPYFDVANIQYIHSGEKKFSGPDNPSEIRYWNVQVGAPLKLQKDLLIFNPSLESYRFMLSPPLNSWITVYGVSLPITFLKQWKNEKWKTAFVFIPRINSDFKNINNNDYQFGGAVLAVYKKNENLRYKFGVYYNSEFFGTFILPLLGIEWNINERMNLFGVLPGNMTFEYKLCHSFYGGINFKSITNSYRYNDSPYLKISDNYLKLFVDFYATKHLVLSLEAGHSALRKYSIGSGDAKLVESYRDGTLFKVGLAYRIRLDEKK